MEIGKQTSLAGSKVLPQRLQQVLQIISNMQKQVISINYSPVMERGFSRSPTC